jgi:hypothetical protein
MSQQPDSHVVPLGQEQNLDLMALILTEAMDLLPADEAGLALIAASERGVDVLQDGSAAGCPPASDEPDRYHPHLPHAPSASWGIPGALRGGIKKFSSTLPRPREQSRCAKLVKKPKGTMRKKWRENPDRPALWPLTLPIEGWWREFARKSARR